MLDGFRKHNVGFKAWKSTFLKIYYQGWMRQYYLIWIIIPHKGPSYLLFNLWKNAKERDWEVISKEWGHNPILRTEVSVYSEILLTRILHVLIVLKVVKVKRFYDYFDLKYDKLLLVLNNNIDIVQAINNIGLQFNWLFTIINCN